MKNLESCVDNGGKTTPYFFFLRNEISATEVIKTFDKFSHFLDLKSIMQSAKLLELVSKKGLRWHSVEWIVLI